MRKISLVLILMVFGVMGGASSALLAQDATPGFGSISQDSKEPIEITANQLEFNDESGIATFEGDVLIIQGDLRLTAEFIEVVYSDDRSKIDSMIANTNVRLTSGPDKAVSDAADYDLARGSIILTGNVSILQEGNTLVAERAEFDLDTGSSTASGRVKTVLIPTSD
ncbi:MAG: lipopolysaccharide transport periplasmic protein LptA [Marinovum sp.]|nr:lipopolysaccharide transport periplasmic protein LptA [Marinovum sp.]MBT7907903.1 lipopolysaccharide transport periplasmic protein LptA [Marinovum sp.]